MKLLVIKFGKALKTLEREGLLKGGKRVAKAFLAMFHLVGSGDILFITNGVGDSARYRTWHVAEELGLHDFRCSVTIQDNPFLPRYASRFKIFIFHRILYTSAIRKLIENIKSQKKEIIFETDDLLFDPKFFEQSDYFRKINALEKKLYEGGLGSGILKDHYVKVCTTTTSYLADKLKEYGKRVFVVPNKLSNEDLTVIGNLLKRTVLESIEDGPRIRVGYFSGTASHDKDFATITDALERIMEKYPQVELLLVGPLDTDEKINKFKDRVKRLSYAPREKHFENIASVDINLAPLEIGNPFCEARSELKFFEAGILGVPTVAAATRTFEGAIADGIDGFTARSADEWFEKLEKLILDKNFRLEMGKKAKEKTLARYTNKNSHNEKYYRYLFGNTGK
ncbi:MAG: glycosyltransferase [Candidatus Moranbacteria bacterium]|nr:glycosyltransferase [Candidatus Moranbacteria bacterium]